jgi:hypothetical protein
MTVGYERRGDSFFEVVLKNQAVTTVSQHRRQTAPKQLI